MDKFELNHAVTLFTQQTTTINSLWTVYVAATFAAAGYGFTASPLPPVIAAAVTVGFLAFAAPASAGTFRPVRGYVSGDGIFARSGTVPAKAMRCNARMAFVLWAVLARD